MHNNYYNQQPEAPLNYPEHLHTHFNKMYNDSVRYMKKKVKIVTIDQKVYKGTIDHVDNNHVYLLLDDAYREETSNQEEDTRYGYGGYGPGFGGGYGPGYGVGYGAGYGPGAGYGGGLGSAVLPLAALTAISAL